MERKELSNPLDHFNHFDLKQFWRMFIDVHRQSGGEEEFDKREPGYKDAMYKAFHKMLSTLGQPLSADFLIDLHDTAIDGVKNMHGEFFQKGVSNGSASYPLGFKSQDPKNYSCSDAGLTELIAKIRTGNSKIEIRNKLNGAIVSFESLQHITKSDQQIAKELMAVGDLTIVNAAANKSENIQSIEKIIEDYKRNLQMAKDENEKLFMIVTCVKDLEQAHVFSDGNARTMVFLTLNKLLIENGLSPTMVEVPLAFGGLKTQELCQMVREGFKRFEQYRTEKDNQKSILEFLEEKIGPVSLKDENKQELKLLDKYAFIASKYDQATVQNYLKNLSKEDILLVLSERDDSKKTLLHAAAAAGNDKLFFGLLEAARKQGVDLDALMLSTDTAGYNVLHLAIDNGSTAMVKAVLDHINPKHVQDAIKQDTAFGVSAFFKAAHNKNPALLKLLLNCFPDKIEQYHLLTQTKNGLNVLHHLAIAGNLQSLAYAVSILGNEKASELANTCVPKNQKLDDPPWNIQLKQGESAFDMSYSNKVIEPQIFPMVFRQSNNNHTLRDICVDSISQAVRNTQDLISLKELFERYKDTPEAKVLRGEHGFHGLFSGEGNTKHWQKVVDIFQSKANDLRTTDLKENEQAALNFIMSIPKTRFDVLSNKVSSYLKNSNQ